MKCDNPGCKNEGRIVTKVGVICWECNDLDIEYMESKFYTDVEKSVVHIFDKPVVPLIKEEIRDVLQEKAKNHYEGLTEYQKQVNKELSDNRLVLSERDFNMVQDVLKNPPKPNEKLLKAFKSVAEESTTVALWSDKPAVVKIDLAEQLLDKGAFDTPNEFANFLNTGDFTEKMADLMIKKIESEKLKIQISYMENGQTVTREIKNSFIAEEILLLAKDDNEI